MANSPNGVDLIGEIESRTDWTPRLWWLGHAGFAIKYHSMIFYIDPCLSAGEGRLLAPPIEASRAGHADMILATHAHARHMDRDTLLTMLEASRRAKLILPKSAAAHAHSLGIGYDRMTTTDADLRIEYFRDGDYIRVYAVPSAHPGLDYTPLGGYPHLGYLIRCGGTTIYHAGDTIPYESLADRLKPYSVTVAVLPIDGRRSGNFTVEEASLLAEQIGAQWLIPMHYGTFSPDGGELNGFIEHMLFHRPSQRFKVFDCGEGWTVPED